MPSPEGLDPWRHALSARARLSVRGACKRGGQSLLFWRLETGLSVGAGGLESHLLPGERSVPAQSPC